MFKLGPDNAQENIQHIFKDYPNQLLNPKLSEHRQALEIGGKVYQRLVRAIYNKYQKHIRDIMLMNDLKDMSLEIHLSDLCCEHTFRPWNQGCPRADTEMQTSRPPKDVDLRL